MLLADDVQGRSSAARDARPVEGRLDEDHREDERNQGRSTFPFNRRMCVYPDNLVKYRTRRVGLPPPGMDDDTFVLVTNAATLNDTGLGLTITQDMLTNRMQLDENY